MKRKRRRRRGARSRSRRVVLVLVGILVLASFAGALSAVSIDQAETYRPGDAPVVGMGDDRATVATVPADSIQDGVNDQMFATVDNNLDSSATYTVEITPDAAEGNVTFVSTASVSVSGDGTVATVDFDPGESITLSVDVASNASDVVDTADFVLSGSTDDGKISADLDERTGPDVVS